MTSPASPAPAAPCAECNGTGQQHWCHGGVPPDCDTCNGTGQAPSAPEPEPRCTCTQFRDGTHFDFCPARGEPEPSAADVPALTSCIRHSSVGLYPASETCWVCDALAAARQQGAEAEREALDAEVLSRLAAYPEDVFREPPPGEHGITVDACSARALRLGLWSLNQWIRARATEL